jgi:predicted DsbA family dithiol-disulfide isomerase
LEDLFKAPPADIQQKLQHLKEVADELGLPLGNREKTYNSRLAQELSKWAESQDKSDAIHNALFRAYFVDDLNIADISVLTEVGESIGLPGEKIREILETRAYKQAVDSDWSRCYDLAIKAVPTFLFNGQALVGAQSYENLSQFLDLSNVNRRQPI